MFTRNKFLIVYLSAIAALGAGNAFCKYDNQPKIMLKNSDLVLEAAHDRNITLRLSGESSVFVNNVNLMEKIHHHYAPASEDSKTTKQTEMISKDAMRTEIQRLHDDLERFALRLMTMQNRTRRTLQLGVIRRNLGRINRLNGRLLALERKLKKDECAEATDPCKNGGTCYDSYNGFHCECTEGYTGKTCEDDVDECYLLSGTDMGCQNNAVCLNTPGSYKCNCAKGFSGNHCRLRNAICHQAQFQELCVHGTCVPANNQQGYTCICEQGWSRNTTIPTNSTNMATLACDIDLNECAELSNPCHSECINLPGSFKCGPCPAGYTGNGVTCLDIDECATDNGGCSSLPKVRCINTEGSYFCGSCPPGWVGDGHACEIAPSNSCDEEKICHPQAKCEYISDVASCTCAPGTFGHGFGPRGCHTSPSTDSCENHICQNNGTCVASGRTTSCICPNGYSGALCETADGCHPNPCQNDGSCKPLAINAFKCSCRPGTTGKRCEVFRTVCGQNLRQEIGQLKYPSSDEGEYSIYERCAWIIRTSPSQIINVTFTKFDVEESRDCTHDWLQVHDGKGLTSQLIGRFCGKDLPLGGNILSSQHMLFFWFQSDNATNRLGFEMSWVSQPHVCGANLELSNADTGVIKSPGYPGRAPANRDCQWQLSAPFGYRFVLRIYDIKLGFLPNCTADYLLVSDADLELKKYCQSSSSEVLHSATNKVSLYFHTAVFSADRSFQLHYEVEPGLPHCGGVFTEPTGYIIGPSERATCLYLIQQPSGTQIKWTFLDFESFEATSCDLNKIELFDGKTDEDSLILSTCGGEKPEPVTSSNNYLLVRYKNSFVDETRSNKPIKAKYSRVCEMRVFGPDAGVLTTPNYPKPYAEQLTCTFHIYGPAETVIVANFTDFNIAEIAANNEEGAIIEDVTSSNSIIERNKLNDESITYVDIFLSSTNKRRYHKGAPMVLRSERNVMTVVFHATTNEEKARGFRIEYNFESVECGGVYVGNEAPLEKTVLDEECVIILEAPEGKHIKLDLDYTVLGDRGEFLIYANDSSGGDFLLKNATLSSKIKETFYFNTITLVLKLRMKISGAYQFVNTAQACGGNFSSLFGAIMSPSWPRSYPPNLECVWIITVPLGNKIELQVHNFTLEPICAGDKLEIRNGKFSTSPLIGRYCANQIPPRIVSFANSLYIRLTTDNYREGSGFYINWQQTTTGCGGKLTSYEGSIHTPHFDSLPETIGMQDANLICDWQIVVSQSSSIDLKVTTAVDEFEFCDKNNLKFYDGSSTLSPLLRFNCSRLIKGEHLELKASSNKLLIVYSLNKNSKYTTPEFIIDYVTNCRVVLENHHGIIESPNFPEKYPPELKCTWDLKAGRNNKIKLAFSHFSLEVLHMTCEYDYVEVWDMKDMDILKKYHFCFQPSETILSEGNRLVVHFVTDYHHNENGFRAEYNREGCGEHMNKIFGYITSPNSPYSNDLDCDWIIEVEAGNQIVFLVTDFHIESESPDCSQNVLYLKESKNSSMELAKECQEQQVPLTITSPGNILYVHFHTSPIRSRKYFKAYYHTKVAACGGTLRGTSGIISSPNYPHPPIVQSYNCVWDITVPESYGVLLNFKHFHLSKSPNCTDASLAFYKVTRATTLFLDKFCGTEKPSIKLLHGNSLRVEYEDTGKQELGIFAIEFRKQCGGLLTDSVGYIRSLPTEECVWEMDTEPGTLITLTILKLDCYCRKHSDDLRDCKNGLGFKENNFDEDLQSSNYTLYVCESHQANLAFEAAKLHIFANNINFRAKYATTHNQCSGYIESGRGSLASPYYPSTYPANIECTWTIQGTKGSFLELQFTQFEIVDSERCNEDYLEVREWSEGKVLGVFCGSKVPQKTLMSYGRFWIKFRSAEGNTGKGFKLSWNHAHLNELVNKTNGYISSPPLKMVQHDELPYAWRILVPRGQFIQLNFVEYNDGLKLFDGFDQTGLPVDIVPSPWRFVSSSNVVFLQTDNENIEKFDILWNATATKALDANATTSKCHSEEFIKVHRYNAVRVFSPGYPRGYENSLNCEWIFKPVNSIEHVAVALLEVDLETTFDCNADYLKISTSVDLVSWYKQEQLCNGSKISKWGKETPFLWVHGTPHIKLEFVTDWSVNRTGFMAKVLAKCGSNMTESVGFIDGAMFHDFNDGINSQCVWHVHVRPGKRIRVRLDYPNVLFNKGDSDDQCSNHALLYDGVDDHAPLIMPGKLCFPQNVTTISVNSTTNHLTIKYTLNLNKVSPRLINLKFWNLTYREFSECNEEIRLIPEAAEIIVTSPSYPNVPHPHTECEWRIMAPLGEIIQVEFKDRFDMNSRFCSQEYLELYDGSTSLSPKIGRYCSKPPTLRTTQNMLYMHYLTDIAEPRNGFQAVISISRCGGSYSENYGNIKSPGYPASYPSNTQCDFVINLKNKNLIHLNFVDINLPFNETKPQTSDYLEIITIDDGDTQLPSIFVYGNATKNIEVNIVSSKAIIRFHTFVKSLSYRGFSLNYNSVGSYCSKVVTGISGLITMNLLLKAFYTNTCTLKVTVPKKQRVRLEILNMADLKAYNFTHSISFSLYHNFEATSEITTFNPDTFNPESPIQSSDNLMYLKITLPKSDLILRPLKLRYSSDAESLCPDNIEEDDKEGTIDLLNLGGSFNESYYCGIKITLKEEETIVFNISSFLITGYKSIGLSPLLFRDNSMKTYYRKNLTDHVHAQSDKTGTISIVQTKSDRIQQLIMTFKKYSCGGEIHISNGIKIKYPQVHSIDSGEGIMCVWSLLRPFAYPLMGDSSREFRLVGNFTFTESCENEYIELVEGPWSNRTSTNKICREKMIDNFQFSITKSTTHVIYRSLQYNEEKPAFSLSIEKSMTCSSEISVSLISFSIKIDRTSYKNNVECSWIFYTDPGLYLQVKFFDRFFIEDSANCSKDYLEIQRENKGVWEPEARFCGREAPILFNSTSSRIQITFRTDEAVTAEGFTFLVQSHCTRVINVTSVEMQRILGPPKNLPPWQKLQCEYIFQGSATDKMILVRTKFETSGQFYVRDSCRLRSLAVTKRDESGKELPIDIHCEVEFEERAEKYIRFAFDAYRRQRFTMEYAYDSCGGNLTKPAVIRHLKHKTENTYAENMNCVWYVNAPPEHSIAVRFKYFSTEEMYDKLTIYRGLAAKRDKLVARLSGNYTSTAPIVIDSNQALISAISDSTGFGKGFEANIIFLPNCNERLSLTEGNSPVTLTRNIKFNSSEQYICNYRIEAPKSYRVRVEIKKLQINGANSTCQRTTTSCASNCNYLEIFDSPSKFESAFTKFCASASINKTFLSFYESAYLRLDASQPGQYSFEILLKMEKTECGPAEYKLGDKEIFKFSFPSNGLAGYAPNTHCSWRLISDHNLEFHFKYLDLQNKSQVTGQCLDYINIRDEYYVNRLCGRSENFTINGVNQFSDIIVTFHSDESEEGRGFEFIAQRADACNRTYNMLSNSISYSGYKSDNIICNDTIVVPENYTLNFYINTMYFRNYNCERLHLKITDLKTHKTLLSRCQSAYSNVNLFTTTNAVRIESSEFNSIGFDYSASNSSLPPGCGGVFRTHKGQFSSPPYGGDRNFSECRWDIIIPTSSEKTLQFNDFNMGTITNCHLDNVKLIESLPNKTEKLLKTFCGPNLPSAVTSTSGHIVVVSKKSPNFDGIGWTLSYDSSNFHLEPKVFINNS